MLSVDDYTISEWRDISYDIARSLVACEISGTRSHDGLDLKVMSNKVLGECYGDSYGNEDMITLFYMVSRSIYRYYTIIARDSEYCNDYYEMGRIWRPHHHKPECPNCPFKIKPHCNFCDIESSDLECTFPDRT